MDAPPPRGHVHRPDETFEVRQAGGEERVDVRVRRPDPQAVDEEEENFFVVGFNNRER